MGDFSEDMHCHNDMAGNEICECTDLRGAAGNYECPCRQRNSWSMSSDRTGYSERTGSSQPENDNVEDTIYDRESWRHTLTSDEAQSPNNMPSRSLQRRKEYPDPQQDQYLSARGKPFQAPLPGRFYGQSTEALEAMPEDFDAQFDSLRDEDLTLTNTRFGVSVGLPHNSNVTKLQPSMPKVISPLPPPIVPKQMSLPSSQKRPPLPSKPPQGKPDQTTPMKAQPYYQPSLPATDHQGQTQQFQTPEATRNRDSPVLPPKPKNANTKPHLPPKPNNFDAPPPRPPKPQQENHQHVLPRQSKQEAQKQPSLPPKSGVESQQPPRLAQRNVQPPKPLPQSPHPTLPLQPSPRQLTEIQPRTETRQTAPSFFHQRQQATPTASTSSEEITDSAACLATQTQTSSRNTSTQYKRHSHRRPHCILSTRNLLIASVTSLLLSLASVSLLVTIMVNPFNFSWRDRTFKEGAYKTCVKCDYLIQDMSTDLLNPDFKILDNEPRGQDIYCCATTSQQMTTLLKLVLRQQEYRPSTKKIIEPSQATEPSLASAHLRLNASNMNSTLLSDKHILAMLPPGPMRTEEHNKTVKVNKYGLKIQTTGYYYVYSSVSYSISGYLPRQGATSKLLEHKIKLVRPSNTAETGDLVKTAHTFCPGSKPSGDKETSFAGGIFLLVEEDQLATLVTDVTASDVDVHSYLGVILLGK
ncbi:hypothetical protein BsWGS_03875 [Bradybaena similaris]